MLKKLGKVSTVGRTTVGSLPRCRWRVRWSCSAHNPVLVYVHACHRSWKKTIISCSRHVDGVGEREQDGQAEVRRRWPIRVEQKRGTLGMMGWGRVSWKLTCKMVYERSRDVGGRVATRSCSCRFHRSHVCAKYSAPRSGVLTQWSFSPFRPVRARRLRQTRARACSHADDVLACAKTH